MLGLVSCSLVIHQVQRLSQIESLDRHVPSSCVRVGLPSPISQLHRDTSLGLSHTSGCFYGNSPEPACLYLAPRHPTSFFLVPLTDPVAAPLALLRAVSLHV